MPRTGASSAPAGLKVRADGLARHPEGAGAHTDREVLPQQLESPAGWLLSSAWLHIAAYLRQGRRAGWQ